MKTWLGKTLLGNKFPGGDISKFSATFEYSPSSFPVGKKKD